MTIATSQSAGSIERLPRRGMVWKGLVTGLVVVALFGVGIAAYLAWENSRGGSGVCTIVHGCSTVQQSKYGKILGVPVSVPGLGLYALLALSGVVWLTNFRGWRAYAALVGAFGAGFGFLFSLFLTYLEAFVIDAWCIYCIVSAVLLTVLLAGWAAVLSMEARTANEAR